MNTRMLIYGAVLTGLFSVAALACLPPPPCPQCTQGPGMPDCTWLCAPNGEQTCCQGDCCTNACCDEVEKCYNNTTHHCCGQGDGHICQVGKSCCGSNCCDHPYCCDHKACFDPNVKECCNYGDGTACNKIGERCCDGICLPPCTLSAPDDQCEGDSSFCQGCKFNGSCSAYQEAKIYEGGGKKSCSPGSCKCKSDHTKKLCYTIYTCIELLPVPFVICSTIAIPPNGGPAQYYWPPACAQEAFSYCMQCGYVEENGDPHYVWDDFCEPLN